MTETPPRRAWLPWVLFVLTVASTVWAGMMLSDDRARVVLASNLLGFELAPPMAWWEVAAVWRDGLAFSASLLAILVAHEMGHFLTARRYRVDVSPPYFLPAPMLPFGTLGAVIRMSEKAMPGRALMRIAAFGPFAGAVVALPVLVLGVTLSDVRPLPPDADAYATFGECLLLKGAIALGGHAPGPGEDLWLHPVGVAAWAGLFVTGLNLLPLGQLDGGHVMYALLGPRFGRIVPVLFAALLILGVVAWPGWLTLGALVWFVIGIKHPPTMQGGPVSGVDRAIGLGAVALFVLTFTPVPIS